MRRAHGRWVLLIALFLMIYGWSTQVWALEPFASAGMDPVVRIASRGKAAGLGGPTTGNDMLQFKAGGHLLGFQARKVYFASLDHALSVEFLGTEGVMPKAAAEGRERDSRSKVPILSKVLYEGLWEGISLMYEAREGGIVESTYHIRPGGETSKIRWRYNVPVQVESDGSLRFEFEGGYLRESRPVAWQEIGGNECRWRWNLG